MRANSKFVEDVRKWEYSFLIVLANANRKILLLDINPFVERKKDKTKEAPDGRFSLCNAIHQGNNNKTCCRTKNESMLLYLRKLFGLFGW